MIHLQVSIFPSLGYAERIYPAQMYTCDWIIFTFCVLCMSWFLPPDQSEHIIGYLGISLWQNVDLMNSEQEKQNIKNLDGE